MGVHQRLGRHDEDDRLALGWGLGAAADRGGKGAGVVVDGGGALGGLGLDVAADGGLLGPAAVVAVVVLVLLADAGQGGAGSGPAGGRLLGHRVEDLLGAGGAADDALDAREQVVGVDDALREARGVAVEGRMGGGGRAPCLGVGVVAVAEVVVFGGLVVVVAALGPDPGGEAGGGDGDGEDQGHPVAARPVSGGALEAARGRTRKWSARGRRAGGGRSGRS